MSTPPDSRRKGALAQIARRAMQAHGFLPDFSAAAIKELETVQPVDRGAESPAKTCATCSGHRLTTTIPWTWTS